MASRRAPPLARTMTGRERLRAAAHPTAPAGCALALRVPGQAGPREARHRECLVPTCREWRRVRQGLRVIVSPRGDAREARPGDGLLRARRIAGAAPAGRAVFGLRPLVFVRPGADAPQSLFRAVRNVDGPGAHARRHEKPRNALEPDAGDNLRSNCAGPVVRGRSTSTISPRLFFCEASAGPRTLRTTTGSGVSSKRRAATRHAFRNSCSSSRSISAST